MKLDDNLGGEKATFIKLDIEGWEQAGLDGAAFVIEQYKPKLAICIYHYFNDIFEIPLHLMNNYPFYDYYIRHHHLGTLPANETVLYAIPKGAI